MTHQLSQKTTSSNRIVSGFSLLELSIVLAIIGTILAGTTVIGLGGMEASRYNATVKRVNEINKALLNYSVVFDRLPCPSSLTLASTNANYGVEAANKGACTGGTPAADFSTPNAVEGGVPTRTLQLPDEYMFDAWGRRFRYAVDPTITSDSSLPTCTITSTITVKDATASKRSGNAAYSLISHGANGHGGYTHNGIAFNAGSTNTDEQTNCHCDASAASTAYSPTYVQKLPTANSGTATDNFDDIVTYKEHWQLTVAQEQPTICQDIYIADSWNNRIRKVTSANGIISTVVGTGVAGFNGDGGAATNAQLRTPHSVTVDSNGNMYIGDFSNHRVRKVTAATGIISTIAGTGVAGFNGDGIAATAAQLSFPRSVALDSSGNIYIAEGGNHRIRKITVATGIISTVAGIGPGAWGYNGDGISATSARLYRPTSVVLDSSGNIYISDYLNHRIRKVTVATGLISTVAGAGTAGFSGDGGAATSAQLYRPISIAVDSSGNIYIADSLNHRIRKVTAATGIISTMAGTGTAGFNGDGIAATSAQLNEPTRVALDSGGNLYIADLWNDRIRKITAATGIISTVAGGWGSDEEAATSAQLSGPWGVTLR